MSRAEAEQKLAATAVRLREAAARLEQVEEELAAVEDQRSQILGEAQIAKRAISDFEQRMEQSREELAAVEIQEAHDAFAETMRVRDAAVQTAAASLDEVVRALDELALRRSAAESAHEQVMALDRDATEQLAPEPDLLADAWERVLPALRERLEENLEADIVDAAARSGSFAIDELPEHLRELARQKRRKTMRAALDASRNPATEPNEQTETQRGGSDWWTKQLGRRPTS